MSVSREEENPNARKANRTFWKFSLSCFTFEQGPLAYHLNSTLLKSVSLAHLGLGKIIAQIWVSISRAHGTIFHCASSVLSSSSEVYFWTCPCMLASSISPYIQIVLGGCEDLSQVYSLVTICHHLQITATLTAASLNTDSGPCQELSKCIISFDLHREEPQSIHVS